MIDIFLQEFQDDLDRDLDELSEQVDKELEKCGDLVSLVVSF